MSDQAQKSKISLLIAFAVGAALAAIVCLAMPKQQATTDSEATAPTGTVEQVEAAAPFDNANIDYAVTFPSWNKDSASLAEIVEFVSSVTDESSDSYVEPADRIATFDMDGTIICEKAPVYVDYCLTMHRVLDDPSFEATDEERSSMEKIREVAYTQGETYKDVPITKDQLVASAFAGMTQEEFRSYVVDFIDNNEAVGFSGMTYGESFYKPMLEIIDYLRANDFDVWMVSACEREVVRAIVERLGIPEDHVIATDVEFVSTKEGDEDAAEYTMSQDEEIVLGDTLLDEAAKTGKSIAIAREIGKYPLMAFGNSSGDYAMLNYAESNPDHKGMGVLVVADDEAREYGSEEKAKEIYETVKEESWTPFSMRDDWATIYGDKVEKTELPGVEEVETELAEAA